MNGINFNGFISAKSFFTTLVTLQRMLNSVTVLHEDSSLRKAASISLARRVAALVRKNSFGFVEQQLMKINECKQRPWAIECFIFLRI